MNIHKENKIKHGLYIVSTPIGNLGDITLRAIDILKKSEFILCEDTRVSQILLNRYNIKSKLVSNHKFNEKKNVNKIIQILKSKSTVSLISDAGTPCISDPGAIIINECYENKIDIFPVPGASAVNSALSISGFLDQYFFFGFFPETTKDVNIKLKELSMLNCSIVFFVSPKKINKAIKSIKEFFFDRKILICREISKLYEEYIRTNVTDLEKFDKIPKGELTIVLSEKRDKKERSDKLDESDKKLIKLLIKKLTIKEITNIINYKKALSKKEVYNYCLELKNEK